MTSAIGVFRSIPSLSINGPRFHARVRQLWIGPGSCILQSTESRALRQRRHAGTTQCLHSVRVVTLARWPPLGSSRNGLSQAWRIYKH